MTTNLSDMPLEEFNANFSEMLAKAHAIDAGEALPDDANQETDAADEGDIVSGEETVDDTEREQNDKDTDEDASDDTEREQEPEIDPALQKSVKYFKEQAKREADRAALAEARLNDLIRAIESGIAPKAPAEAKQEFEPLDEEAHKVYTQKQQELEQRLIHQEFTQALQHQEAAARAANPDFDKAFEHLQSLEISKLKAMGASEDVAAQEVKRALANTAFAAWRQGRDVGKMFYDMAKSVGYNGQKQSAKMDVNHDAIAKNRARTERKPVKEANPASGGHNLNDRLQTAFKDGRVDPNQFQRLLKEYGSRTN